MAAILGRPRRPRFGPRIVNTYVEDRGRRYRVCHTAYGCVLLIGYRRSGERAERLIDVDGRLGRRLVRLSGVKLDPTVEVRS